MSDVPDDREWDDDDSDLEDGTDEWDSDLEDEEPFADWDDDDSDLEDEDDD